MSRFYTNDKLGEKRSTTPEGFLLCEEVPIARTGMMIYGPNEVPIIPGEDGLIRIVREEKEVFSPTTIASYQGKPVTIGHPDEDVTPDNWKDLAVGTCINPRRGSGAYDDLLLADLLITRKDAIELINRELPEVSCGYEADYEEEKPGLGYQCSIVGNHVALVKSGRCGPRCAIGDQSTVEEKLMSKKTWKDRLRQAFGAKDEAAMEEVLNEVPSEVSEGGEDTHIHIHAGDQPAPSDPSQRFSDDDLQAHIEANAAEHASFASRLDALEAALAAAAPAQDEELTKALGDEAPEGKEEEAVKAKDSSFLVDSFRNTVAQAEILVPGIRIPTFDRAAEPGQTFKKICTFRRQALDLAYAQPTSRAILDDLLVGKTLDTKNMTCDAIRQLFNSAASVQKSSNNSGKGRTSAPAAAKTGINSIADLNVANKKHWA